MAAAEERVEDEEEEPLDDEVAALEDHLKDAVEGSLRLKRLLTQDEDESGPAKKKRRKEEETKIQGLLNKWGLAKCAISRHVLDQASTEELNQLIKSKFVPEQNNGMKSRGELLDVQLTKMRQQKLATGGEKMDPVTSFRTQWKLGAATEKTLRALSYAALSYVVRGFTGDGTLEDIIADAQGADPGEEEDAAIRKAASPMVVGRTQRLELIDPLADCAVFGDANLTFSLKLAKHRKALGHVGRVIATTFEELDTLRERYKEIDESIKVLEEHYAEVYHAVDCTRIAIDPRFSGLENSLGAVYYNFPHSGAVGGFFDGHPMVNWRHENLMRLFFRALRAFVKPGGVVKVTSNKNATGVRYSYIVGSALENEFVHMETVPFTEWHLHRYGRSYGDKRDSYKRLDAKNNQSYNAQKADADMIYCFRYAPTGETIPKQEIRHPPSLKTLMECADGPFKQLAPGSKERATKAKQLHERFVTEVSGTHVG